MADSEGHRKGVLDAATRRRGMIYLSIMQSLKPLGREVIFSWPLNSRRGSWKFLHAECKSAIVLAPPGCCQTCNLLNCKGIRRQRLASFLPCLIVSLLDHSEACQLCLLQEPMTNLHVVIFPARPTARTFHAGGISPEFEMPLPHFLSL